MDVGNWKAAAALSVLVAAALAAPAWGGTAAPDGLVAADGSAAYVTGSIQCAGHIVVSVQLALLQSGARGVGTTRTTCTYGVATFRMLVITSMGALAPGGATACYQADAVHTYARGCTPLLLRR
jgi:hypothetical protein